VTKGDSSEPVYDAQEVVATPAKRVLRRRDDQEFDVVWNGVGPLPGTGDADGLGSTLSGVRFSIGAGVRLNVGKRR
jgi:hypothetical protein